MRFIIPFLFLLAFPVLSQGQDYSCIPGSGEQFFTDGELYRAVRIDSVSEFNDHSSYYNFFSLGPVDDDWWCFTDEGPSWIGSHVDVYENGDHFFFNRYGDSIYIKTLAAVNESWVCFSFDGGDYIQAKVTSLASEQFLGFTDSVRTIQFNAYDLSGNPVNCGCNGLKIKISKSHGMTRTLNFRVFPDLYDMIMGEQIREYDLCGMSDPETGIQNLTIEKIFDFEVGDEFHIHEYSSSWLEDFFFYYEIHRVLGKEWISDTVIAYTMEACVRREYIPGDTLIVGHDTSTLFVNIKAHDDPAIDYLPEKPACYETGMSEYYWYNQAVAPVPDRISKTYLGGFFYEPGEDCIMMVIDFDYSKYYVEGLGGPYWNYGSFGSENSREIVYFKKGDEEWGEPYQCDSLLVSAKETGHLSEGIVVAPNPMQEWTRIEAPGTDNTEYSYQLISSFGLTLRTGILDKPDFILHREGLHAGLYILVIKRANEMISTRKLIIR